MTNFENELAKSLKDKLQNNHWDLSEDNSFIRMAKEVSKDVDYFVKDEEDENININKTDLVNLSGQVINGIMSSDDSLWVKLFDRTDHKQVAGIAVDIAYEMLKEINKKV